MLSTKLQSTVDFIFITKTECSVPRKEHSYTVKLEVPSYVQRSRQN